MALEDFYVSWEFRDFGAQKVDHQISDMLVPRFLTSFCRLATLLSTTERHRGHETQLVSVAQDPRHFGLLIL